MEEDMIAKIIDKFPDEIHFEENEMWLGITNLSGLIQWGTWVCSLTKELWLQDILEILE